MEILFGIILIPIIIFVIEVVIILNILQDPSINNNSRIFWVVLLLFTNILGLIIYFIVGDKNILE